MGHLVADRPKSARRRHDRSRSRRRQAGDGGDDDDEQDRRREDRSRAQGRARVSRTETLAFYGHPFSSYTWKAQIALDVCGPEYEFRMIDAEYPENGAFVAAHAGPFGNFPVLVDGDNVIFE